jgi:hypothetical protein
MPDEVAGVARVSGSSGEARYRTGDLDFGIEASEIEDAYGPGTTVDEAIQLLAEDLVAAEHCDLDDTWCLSGGFGDGVVVVWGDRGSGVMIASVAPTEPILEQLLRAWEAAVG